jgi:hypothetical protein
MLQEHGASFRQDLPGSNLLACGGTIQRRGKWAGPRSPWRWRWPAAAVARRSPVAIASWRCWPRMATQRGCHRVPGSRLPIAPAVRRKLPQQPVRSVPSLRGDVRRDTGGRPHAGAWQDHVASPRSSTPTTSVRRRSSTRCRPVPCLSRCRHGRRSGRTRCRTACPFEGACGRGGVPGYIGRLTTNSQSMASTSRAGVASSR